MGLMGDPMEEIEQNRQFAAAHGWAPDLWGAAGFDAQLVEGIRAWQAAHALLADGVCGTETYGAKLDAVFDARRPHLAAEDPEARLRSAGELAVNRATRLWLDDIHDPPSADAAYERARHAIDGMIRGESGLHWAWRPPYVKNNDFAWCGAFMASAWGPAGLARAVRETYCASTHRLDRGARYESAVGEKPTAPPTDPTERRKHLNVDADRAGVVPFGPRAGDIVLVAGKDHGDHIALVESFDPDRGVFRTIEGNGFGQSPTGKRIEGVIRREQPLSEVRRIIRWSVHDLSL